jgi:hypothetical protein
MPNVTVSFDRIDVDQDGDPGVTDGMGEWYWTQNLNGARVGFRSVANPLSVGNGGSIDLGASRSIELRDDQELTVTGFVGEKDQLGTGSDEKATINDVFDRSQNWGDGSQEVPLADRRMSGTLYYTIQAE